MDISIHNAGAFSSVLISLQPHEEFFSESGAMYRSSSNISIDVTTRSKGKGGLLQGVKRTLANESFFISHYSCKDDDVGEVGLAPVQLGEIQQLTLNGQESVYMSGGSYLGHGSGIHIESEFQRIKGMFSGESLFFLKATGQGTILTSAYGKISCHDIDGSFSVDISHLVAFTGTLQYSVGKASSSWISSILSGEGMALHFQGKGKIWVQSHNPNEFGKHLGPLLPNR